MSEQVRAPGVPEPADIVTAGVRPPTEDELRRQKEAADYYADQVSAWVQSNDVLHRKLREAEEAHAQLKGDYEREWDDRVAADKRVRELEEELANTHEGYWRNEAKKAEQGLEEAVGRLEVVEADLSRCRRQRDNALSEVVEVKGQWAADAKEIAALTEDRDGWETSARQHRGEADRLARELKAAQSKANSLEQTLADIRGDISGDKPSPEIGDVNDRVDNTNVFLNDLRGRVEGLEKTYLPPARKISELERAADKLGRRVLGLENQEADLDRRVRALESVYRKNKGKKGRKR